MKKYLLLLIFTGCISEQVTAPQVQSYTYHGIIKQYLQNVVKAQENLTIEYKDSLGTFTARGKITIVDSIRAIVINGSSVKGYLFPSDISFDSAFKWTKTLLPINFILKSDSLNGSMPPDWNGFYYQFSTVRQ